jgi:hypothetical protein
MTHRAIGIWRIVQSILLVVAILAAGAFWFRGSFEKQWNVPHAIYSTAQLVDVYHVHKAKHGTWPQPGQYVAKEVEFVTSYSEGGARVDVFNFGGGQYALVYVHEKSLEAIPVRDWRPASGAQ